MGTITEGKAGIKIRTAKVVSKAMPVFYNPFMELNRTISVLLLNSIDKKNMQIALPLSGSGIRGIRLVKELKKGKIKNISFNDYDNKAVKSIKENLKLNKIKMAKDKVIVSNKDANLFLLGSCGFDYIDIDPFGTPNPFLDSAVKRISRNGIIAVTATDTSALCGASPKACMRKYWAKPLRNAVMHEIGLRILIRKCQLIGAQFDKALKPIYSYSKDHYMRIFFLCEKGKEKVDEILKQHDVFNCAGPIWIGKLWDNKLAERLYKAYGKGRNPDKGVLRFLSIIKDESKINKVGFYNIPSIVKGSSLASIPRQEGIISVIRKKGYKVSETHFAMNSIRSNIPEKVLAEIIRKKN